MPLEDLTGAKYVSDLNPDWPLGSDYPSDGDDHIRGIKNVLQKTFPNVTGPVTLTQNDFNRGSVPSGSRMVFYQAAAPTGWTRVAGINATYMMRVRASTHGGGGSGGSDDPVLNNKVPTHAHTVSGNTQNTNVDHSHWVSLTSGTDYPDHIHGISHGASNTYGWVSGSNVTATAAAVNSNGASTRHQHHVSGYTGGQSAQHVHYISLNTGGPHSGTTGNWVPRYLDVIVCQRS